jgi:glycosyltransferase involved in cell wall biosynthesis
MNAGTPKVSVIMPAFNRERFIAESIRSVLGQSSADFELIVIDDGSTDGTVAEAEAFKADPRVRIFRNDRNLGIARTRNRGLELARADYVALLDSDDVWLDAGKLGRQTAFLDANPDYALVGGGIRHMDTEGRELRDVVFPAADAEIRRIVLQFNPFAQSALMYRKAAVLEAGGYSADYQVCDDYALWLAVGTRHKFANFADVLTGYRVHGGNITRTKRLTAAREILEIVRANAKNYPHAARGISKAYVRLLFAYMRT